MSKVLRGIELLLFLLLSILLLLVGGMEEGRRRWNRRYASVIFVVVQRLECGVFLIVVSGVEVGFYRGWWQWVNVGMGRVARPRRRQQREV